VYEFDRFCVCMICVKLCCAAVAAMLADKFGFQQHAAEATEPQNDAQQSPYPECQQQMLHCEPHPTDDNLVNQVIVVFNSKSFLC